MAGHDDDGALLRKQRQFLQQVEFELRQTNREIIHRRIPELNRESFMRFASFVAELRSDYLQVAIELSRCAPHSDEAVALLTQLHQRRIAYEESREAFAALERTIEQGYVDIGG